MKKYYATIKITWSNYEIEAINSLQAHNLLKKIFLEQYGIELENNEIIEIKEDTDND